jgi:hypothetical protein
MVVSDEGREGEFELINIIVQIGRNHWFGLAVPSLDEETPLACLSDSQVSTAKAVTWKAGELCVGKVIREVVIDSWPTIGIMLEDGNIVCAEFVSTAMRPQVVPVANYAPPKELRSYWGHYVVGHG